MIYSQSQISKLVYAVENQDFAAVKRLCSEHQSMLPWKRTLRTREEKIELINTKTGSDSETVLHIAARKGNLQILAYLCENGADVNARNKDGDTCIHLAVINEHTKVVKYLLEREDVNLEVKNKKGKTAADLANERGYLSMIKLFKQVGTVCTMCTVCSVCTVCIVFNVCTMCIVCTARV